LAWSVSAAIESGVFDTIMVSTDDEEIADVARGAGAEVPFFRSAEASSDYASTADVLVEVLNRYKKEGRNFDIACCIYPTAPFVRPEDLREGRDRLLGSDFEVIMPVTAFSYPIWRSLKREADGKLALNFPEHLNARSQDLSPAFHDAGQWYWFNCEAFLRREVLMGPNTGSIVLSGMQVQDIDSEEDWELAELKHARFQDASEPS